MNKGRRKELSIVTIRFDLDCPVLESMYNYLSENSIFNAKKTN
jgi:hypothetical protein